MPVLRAVIAGWLAFTPLGQHGHAQPGSAPPPLDNQARLVGLPIFTMDGERIGTVIEAGVDDGEMVAVATIRGKRGTKTHVLVIPANLFVIKGARLQILLTAAQISHRLGN